MIEDISFYLLGLSLLFILSAFFSGSETALTALDRLRLKYLVEKKRPGAERLETILAHPDRMLSAVCSAPSTRRNSASVIPPIADTTTARPLSLSLA